jgi:hypothetical protein
MNSFEKSQQIFGELIGRYGSAEEMQVKDWTRN